MSFGASPYGPPTAPQQPENDIVVEMPDGQLVAFKPGTTPQRIAELISSKYPNEIQAMLKKKGVADDALAVTLKGLYNLPGAMAGQKEAISLSAVENIGQIAAPTSLYPDGKKPKPTGTVMEQLEAEIYEMKNGNAAAVPTADADAPVGSRAWLDGKSVPSYDMPGMLEGMPDVKQAVGRWAAEQSLRRQDKLKNIKEDAEKVTVVPGSLDDILGNAVPNLANMVIPVGASILTRRAETGLAIMGAQTYGDAYARGREKGLRPQEATQYGVMTALSEAIPEKLPLSAILAGKGGLLRQFATAVGLEGGTEGLTALLNMAIDKKFLGAEDTWSEASNKLITAIASGAILGGGMSVTAQGIKKFLGEDITDVPPDDKAVPTTEKIVETDFGAPAGVDPGIAETLGNVAAQPLAIEREKRLALPPPSAIEDIVSPIAERQQTIKVMPTEEQLAQKASDRTRATIGAARETATPIGTFSMNEVGNDVAGKVRLRRMRTGRTAPDAPVSVADMQAAGVDQSFIDALIIGRKPLTGEQLTAANRPSLESRAAPAGPFTEEQYSASVAATRNAGRFSIDGVRKAAVSSPRVAKLIRDEMVTRGDLVPGTRPGTFKPYERPAAPATQSPLKTFTVAPVASDTIAVKKDGKVIGVFEDQVAAKNAVRGIREREKAEQNPPSRVEVVRGGVDAEGKAMTERPGFAVYENRYDDEGKLVDRAIVSTHVAEDAARAEAENFTARGVAPPRVRTGPAAFQEIADEVTASRASSRAQRPSVIARSRPQKIPTPKVLEGRVQEVVDRLNEQANKRALPLIGNRVLLTGTITDAAGNADIEGSYLKQLTTLAVDRLDPNMSTDDVVEALAGVMDHETIHALREAGVLAPGTKAWSILSNYVVQAKHPDTGVTYIETAIDRNPDLADRPDVTINGQKLSIVEEAIAEAFRAWAANRRAVAGVPRTALEKIVEWFKRLVSSVPDDVFRSIETGTLARSRIKAPLSYRGAAVEKMEKARADLETATTPEQTLAAEREFLQAREQAAEDRVGRVGPRSVLGTTPSDDFMTGPRASFDRVEALLENAKTTLNKAPSPNRGTPDNTFLMKLADAYDKAPHEPSNTAVSKAYASLVAETKSFFNALNVTVVPWRENGQPYASQRDLIDDAADGQIKMRLSNDLFPPHPSRRNHPMQEPSGFTTEDGSSLSNGDLLRVVAEAYGYAPVGAVPSMLGDYRAYSTIKDMYSPQGQRALATEMLAHSAWQNTGPKMRLTDGSIAPPDALGYVPPNMREFAEQKATLLPAEVLVEPVQPREDILDMSGIGDETRYSRSARNPQVDTPQFKRWFGNSKVVGPDGQPLVVYHGSEKDFSTFSKDSVPARWRDKERLNGFFFSADPQYGYIQRSSNVYPVFLRIENPYFIDRSEKMEGLNAWDSAAEWIDGLRSQGYDGIIWGDPDNLRKPPRGAWGDDRSQIFVFEPTQIKSAIGNIGTFDPTNPDIRYSREAKRVAGVDLDNAPEGWGSVNNLPEQLTAQEREALTEIVRNVSGLSDVRWYDRIKVDRYDEAWGKHVSEATGFYDPTADVIALTTQWGNPKSAYHEAFHRLQWVYLTDKERAFLRAEEPTLRDMMRKYGDRGEVADKMQLSELEAETFGLWATGRMPAPTGLAGAWKKIKDTLARVANYLSGLGYRIPEDIYAAAKRGDIAARTPRGRAARDAVKAERAAASANIRYSRGMSYGPAEKRARDGERGYALGNLAPLAGAPQVEGASGPDPRLVAVAEQYASDNGITLRRQAEYVEVDPVRAKRIADAYEAMTHTPNDPAVNAAYKALIDQTVAQYRALEKAGYKFWFIDPNTAEGAAYASSPWNAMRDLRANQSMGSFPTVAGFGTKEDFNPAANPLLTDTGIRWPFGSPTGPAQPVLANDLFRAVHDAFGHGIEGAGFRAQGEENAWQAHSRLFYGDAVGAITTETRGQNSWLNYGPFGEQNRRASAEDTVFADQKTGLMPEWTWLEGRAGDMGELTADKSYNVGSPEFYAMLDEVVPGGKYYGNPKRAAAAVTSPADTSSPAFSQTRDGNAFFGGDVAYQQLQMARDGDRGAVLIYLHPEDFLRLANTAPVREQDLYTAATNDGLKFNTLPSLVVESGKVGAVPVLNSDGVGMARALLGKAKSIPVVLYPSGKGQIENVDTLTANGNVVDMLGMYEFDISRRGPRQGLSTIAFNSWFKQSAVVDETGAPKRVYDTTAPDSYFGVFDTQSSEFRSHFGTVEQASEISGGRGTGYPTYLSIQNPLRLEDDGSFKTDAVAKQMLDLGVIDAALYDDVVNNTVNGSVALQDAAADAGYDGVVYRTAPDAPENYITFQPTQAKAAVANRGTWSSADPDIRYSRGTSRRRAPTPGDDIYTAAQMKTDGLLGSKVEKIFRSKKGKAVSVFNGRVNFQDKSMSFKEFTDRLNRSGVAIPASINAAMVEEKLQSKAGYQDRLREETMRTPLLAKIEEASKANKFSYKDVDDLLLARHAVERNQFLRAKGSPKHSGISDTDAKDIIDRLRAKGVLREITDLADTYVVPIVKDINNIRIASGQVTPDVVAADPFNYWVPMRDTDDYDPFDVIAKGPKVTGSGAFTSSGRRPDPRMYGRDSKPGDVIANLFTLQSVALMRAERAEVMKAFHKTMQLPGASAVVGDTLKRVLSPPKKLAYGADGMIREIVDQDFRNRPGIIVFKIDGKEVVYKTDDFYLERALKGPLLEPLNSIFDRLVTVAAGYVKLITTRNPAFIILQVSRDLLEALIHSGQYKVPGLARGIVTRLPRAMKAIAAYKLNEKRYKDLFEKSEREKAGATSLLSAAERAEIARISPLVQYYWEADKNGWLVSFLNYQDMSQRIDRIHRDVGLLTGARGKLAEIQKATDSFFHVWDGVNDVFENAARLSFYSTVRDFQKKNQKADGRADSIDAIDEAGMAMKNLTINFNKGGRYKKAMNANFLFSSVIANGAAATGKMLKSKRGQAVIGSVIAFSFVLDMLNRALSDDENEDGIKDYDAMPESDLNRNLYIPVDKLGIPGINEPLQIPLALGPIGAFFSLGRNLSRAINGFMNPRQPVSPLGSVGRVIVSSADAINIVGDTTRPINFFAPWYLDPIVDLTLNKRWTGGDIAPPAYDSTKPNFQRYYSTTNPFYLSLAEGLSDLTGGNEERGGWFDYSPENYKYIVDFLGAGTGKFLGDVYYSGTEAIPLALSGDTELIKGSSIPFVGKFVGTEAETRGARDEYFRLREEVKTTKKEIGSDDRDIRKEGRARIAGGSVVQSAFARADNQLEDLRKKLRAAQENRTMEYTSRLRKIEDIRAKMDAIMAKAVKSYYDRSEKLN